MSTAFERYQSGANDGVDLTEANPVYTQKPEQLEVQDNEQYVKKAKKLVANDFNQTFFPGGDKIKTTAADFYVVWFVKVLGNWKALVSTDVISGQYWEVTYNGAKNETYVDHYVKRHNQAVTDAAYADLP